VSSTKPSGNLDEEITPFNNERSLVESIIEQEIKAFPGITKTHHWPRLLNRCKKYETVSWKDILQEMIDDGRVRRAHKIIGSAAILVMYWESVPENMNEIVNPNAGE